MVELMVSMQLVRSVLDDFCDIHKLSVDSGESFNAAEQCLIMASKKEYAEHELLDELEHWYLGYDDAPAIYNKSGTKKVQS